MQDALTCDRRFRTFNGVDDYNREAFAIGIDLNIPAQRVIWVLDRIVADMRSCGHCVEDRQRISTLPIH